MPQLWFIEGAMSTRSKSGGNTGLRVGLKDGRSKSGGDEGVRVDVKGGKTKSGGNEGLQVGVKEEERFLDVEDLQELISNLKSLPDLLTWEDFRDRYHLECGPNSINPCPWCTLKAHLERTNPLSGGF